MERIGVVGLNWRSGGPERIARFTIPEEQRAERLPALARALGARELVYIATCNRVEVAFVGTGELPVSRARQLIYRELTGSLAAPGEAERSLRAWQGEGAVEHIFLVATGLDSAKLGETEVTGQVRAALDLAKQQELVGPRLELLFREALKLAREARRQTHLGDGRTSLAEIALDFVRESLAKRSGSVALLGVSPMTERCGASLASEGASLLVVNRTLSRAAELCQTLGDLPRACSLAEFIESPPDVAAVVSATGAPCALLDHDALQRLARASSGSPPLLVDLAVPPDIDVEAARKLGFERIGMEGIIATAEQTRSERVLEAGEARELVDEAVMSFAQRLAERTVEGAIRSLHERYQATAMDQVERLMRAKLRGLGDEERDLLRQFVSRLARHFAHLPASGLREVARDHGVDAVQRFFARADQELRRDLEQVFEDGVAFAALGTQSDGHEPEETNS